MIYVNGLKKMIKKITEFKFPKTIYPNTFKKASVATIFKTNLFVRNFESSALKFIIYI